MAENKKYDPVEEQKKRQQELIELKLRKQQFESNPDEFVHEGIPEFAQTTKSKFVNFWYYAKFSIAMLVIVAIILAVGITQCSTRTQYDMTIVLYMKRHVSIAMVENIKATAERYCEDRNGDGEINVLILDCASVEEEHVTDKGLGKATRLQANFSNEEAIVYILDKEAFEELSALDAGGFITDELALPELDGRAFSLNGTVFDNAFQTGAAEYDDTYNNYADSFEYYLARRVVSGTQIEKSKKVQGFIDQANKFIFKVMSDPELYVK